MKVKKYSISHHTDSLLRIYSDRKGFTLQILEVVLFFSIWYFALLAPANSPVKHWQWDNIFYYIYGLFLIVPLLSVPAFVKNIVTAVKGEVLSFDLSMDCVLRNEDIIAHISEIDYIQVRQFKDSESDPDFRVSLVLKNASKTILYKSKNLQDARDTPEILARFLKKDINFT